MTEIRTDSPPGWTHPEWAARFPWMVQGTTATGTGSEPFDLGLFSNGSPAADVLARWESLRSSCDMPVAVHARQMHEATVRTHGATAPGLALPEPCDGHVTSEAGLLLTVSVADCVPVFLVDPDARVVSAIHAGWRGAAAGILEVGLKSFAAAGGSIDSVRVHLGPSICGNCYEVGPEVFEALDQPVPPGPTPIDLRGVLAGHSVDAGVSPDHLTVSTLCTRCTDSGLFSHRRGDRGRQVGYIGIRC